MKRKLISLIWMVFVMLPVSAAYSQPKPKKMPVGAEAMRILKSMSDFLGGLKRFSFKVVNMREDIRSGHRVDFEVAAQVTIERPNKLKAVREGHLLDQEIYYNGTSLVVNSPARKIYARADAPESIDATLKYARSVLGIGYPAADLMYSDTFPLLTKGVISASVIGKEVIAGQRCDHLLFTLPGVDFQIWIADSGEPLPYKYIVTDTGTAQRLSIVAILNSWNLSHPTEERDFNFIPPKGSREIPFRTVDGKSKVGGTPARTKSI
jgi:hypothetical protein